MHVKITINVVNINYFIYKWADNQVRKILRFPSFSDHRWSNKLLFYSLEEQNKLKKKQQLRGLVWSRIKKKKQWRYSELEARVFFFCVTQAVLISAGKVTMVTKAQEEGTLRVWDWINLKKKSPTFH